MYGGFLTRFSNIELWLYGVASIRGCVFIHLVRTAAKKVEQEGKGRNRLSRRVSNVFIYHFASRLSVSGSPGRSKDLIRRSLVLRVVFGIGAYRGGVLGTFDGSTMQRSENWGSARGEWRHPPYIRDRERRILRDLV